MPMYLMLKDTQILYFDFEDFIVEVIRDDLLPFCLRSNIRPSVILKDILHNVQTVKSYLSNRVLSLSRDNAKQIYAAFQIPQIDSIDNRVNICIKCKGVSIQDSYWIKEDDETISWNSVNIRQNKLSDIVDVSLSGFDPTITTNSICPELTTKGLFRKGWIHLGNDLYMLKSDRTNNFVNTKMEILASDVLTCFENTVNCIAYVGDLKETVDGTEFISICKNFVEEEFSFIEAWEVMEYAAHCGFDFRTYCLEQWGHLFASIPILDYIIVNTDRHTQNYGFLMNNNTGKLEKIAPLFDFNCALVADYFNRDARNTLSQMFNTAETLQELAYKFQADADIRFNEQKFFKLIDQNEEYEYIFKKIYARIREFDSIRLFEVK